MSSNFLCSKQTYAVARTGQKVKIDGKVQLVDGPRKGSQALMVGGLKDYTRVYGPASALKLNQGSLSIWARLVDPEKKYSDLVRVNNGKQLYIYHTKDGYFLVFYNNVKLGKSSMTVTDDKWHHYIFTWKDGEQKFYIDGAEVLYGRVSECKGRTALFAIGWLGSGDTEQWHGPFAEFLTFNRALTYSEVVVLYRDGLSIRGKNINYLRETLLMDLDFSTIDPDDFRRPMNPETILKRIDLLHGLYWGLLMVGLFILSRSAGLPNRWAFMSIIIAFLFFGTNRFSYFSYYSLAPSFSSILMYWLWTATFFFKKSWKDILLGLLMAVISIPILYTNHIQEVAFVLFIASIWLIWNISERIWALLNEKNKTIEILQSNNSRDLLTKNDIWYRQPRVRTWMKQNYILILFVVLFISPQFESFQNLISQLSFRNVWQDNQELVIFWKGFHVMGKMWSYRVNDTLGIMSTIPILLCIAFFWPGFIRINGKMKFRILLLGITPFLICFIPVFHFIWVSNVHISAYYRLCYCSIFWITIAYFLYGLEGRFLIYWKKIKSIVFTGIVGSTKRLSFKVKYFTVSLVIIIMIGSIRSGPVYGKLDFILLETRPWWSEWKPMIKNSMKQDRKVIYSDKLTSMVLRDIFNLPIVNKYSGRFHGSVLDVQSMKTGKMSPKYRYIINLHGFNPSWVPKETGHWSPKLANTSLYYRYNRLRGEELRRYLKENPPKNCEVYF